MLITPTNLRALFTGFRAEFQRGLTTVDPTYAQIATVVPSTTAGNTYAWLGQFPKLREWIGKRQVRDMAAHGYAITNKLYESTVDVKRTDIEDDGYGVYKPMFQEAGRAAAIYPDEHVYGLLSAGQTTHCYDGQNFFDTDHPVYPEVDGTGTATTVSNLVQGDQPAWYLLDTRRAIKPVIFQERIKPSLTSMTSEDNEHVFMLDKFTYGIRARSNVGFGFWQMAYCSREPLNEKTYGAAYTALRMLKGDGGRALDIRGNLLVVPPQCREAGTVVTTADKINGTTNPNKGLSTVLEVSHLA
ncbi:Mu-like prophage major head subunit gpT family protein [Pandoraea fibrosis]|uniref:Mu-like prophage FluMu major head subunit gpT n=1 Tax=Pandoraea fibrosis TaxID=1891094 RepID=A0A5E4XGC3_9BURK|nr:Mu-like prophage major head subunit gpT family protein [Pandoraea fibrosis]VVE35282.1 Mu-like prophage FluMu major head subunit gpT [Pandoraea fibrosis]